MEPFNRRRAEAGKPQLRLSAARDAALWGDTSVYGLAVAQGAGGPFGPFDGNNAGPPSVNVYRPASERKLGRPKTTIREAAAQDDTEQIWSARCRPSRGGRFWWQTGQRECARAVVVASHNMRAGTVARRVSPGRKAASEKGEMTAVVEATVEEQMRVLMRGVEYGEPHIQATMEEELRVRLAEGRPLRVYAGFDPTSSDLTLGNLVPMLKLRQFQRFGHEVTFLFGTMTGIVGDPSDRTATRRMLTTEEVDANAQNWLRQVYRVLDRDRTVIRKNADWLAGLTLAEVIDLGSHFTVAQFLERESFRLRLEQSRPIYVHEFLYALMQAYDAHYLQTDVQVGGVDQLFNILAGRTLQRDLGEKTLIAVTTPLIIGTDGHLKMSKSTGNYVGLDDAPADMFGKIMSIPDALMLNYFTLLTDVGNDELSAMEAGLADRTLNPMDTKKRLAHSIVELLYDAASADEAQAEFERVFQRRQDPSDSASEVSLELGPDGKAMVDITQVVVLAGATSSRAEARRLLNQGAISVDGEVLGAPQVELNEGAIIRVGRHRFYRIARA